MNPITKWIFVVLIVTLSVYLTYGRNVPNDPNLSQANIPRRPTSETLSQDSESNSKKDPPSLDLISGAKKESNASNSTATKAFSSRTSGSTSTTLVGVTSCCALWTKLQLMLSTLGQLKQVSHEDFDVLVVDDNSVDGTINNLNEMGVHVIRVGFPNRPTGVTFLWNFLYKYFKENSYNVLIVTNNDVLVPPRVIPRLVAMLTEANGYDIVAPLTTIRGAGWDGRQQGVEHLARYLPDRCSSVKFLNDPLQYMAVQECVQSLSGPNGAPRQVTAFNGFFWAIRRSLIDIEFSKDVLFDPKNINVYNELELAGRVRKNSSYRIGLCLRCFVFHYKASTLTNNNHRESVWSAHKQQTASNLISSA